MDPPPLSIRLYWTPTSALTTPQVQGKCVVVLVLLFLHGLIGMASRMSTTFPRGTVRLVTIAATLAEYVGSNQI